MKFVLVLVVALALIAGVAWFVSQPAAKSGPVAASSTPAPSAPFPDQSPTPIPRAEVKEQIVSGVAPLDSAGFPTGEPFVMSVKEFSASVPEVFVKFRDWTARFEAASPEARPALVAEGLALATERRALMGDLIRENPEAALALAVSPRTRAVLPSEMAPLLETVVAGQGIYGVKAICNHGGEESHSAGCRIEYEAVVGDTIYQASIYGAREQRLTDMDASIYGVAVDGQIALSESDVVVLPASDVSADPAVAGQLAVIFRGQTTLVPDQSALATHLQSLK